MMIKRMDKWGMESERSPANRLVVVNGSAQAVVSVWKAKLVIKLQIDFVF